MDGQDKAKIPLPRRLDMDRQDKDPRLAAAAQLAGLLRETAAVTEDSRRVPPEVIDAFRAAGLFRVFQPPRCGGRPMLRFDWMNMVYEFARHGGSGAWVYMVLSSHAAAMAMFPPEVQDEVWSKDQDALISSAIAPSGKARRTDGGYRLSGKFPFSSGCDYANWALVGGRVDGEPAAPLSFLIPLSVVTILDDWFTVGLAGTGSKTLVAEDIFVPEQHAQIGRLIAGTAAPASFCYTMIGLAQGAMDRFIDHIQDRAKRHPLDWAQIYEAIAVAQGKIDAARLLIERDMQDLAKLDLMSSPPAAMRARNQRDQAVATRLASEAVDTLVSVAGASAIYLHNDFRRAAADAKAAALHGANAWSNIKFDGQVRFGLDYAPPF